jgi:hypothetical protein
MEAKIYVVWDETGEVSAHTDADEAAEILEQTSHGRFRRVLELTLTLPPATAIQKQLTIVDDAAPIGLKAR